MKLQTSVKIDPVDHLFDHQHSFLSMGSCFAEEIGGRLNDRLFNVAVNPLGTVFNPIAIAEIVRRAVNQRYFEEDEFFSHHELWRHFLVQSNIASSDCSKSIARANEALKQVSDQLTNSDVFLLTLGSAWVYELLERDQVVGHNHKLPLDNFNKRLLDVTEVVDDLGSALSAVRKVNPKIKICITVSPVRHLRDGLHENNLSKATLLLASEMLQKTTAEVSYFPAYEILLDELRDYRFFKSDMAHPSEQACDYIWSKFSTTYFTPGCLDLCSQLESIRSSMSHRSQHPETNAYKDFKTKLHERIQNLKSHGLNPESILCELEGLD